MGDKALNEALLKAAADCDVNKVEELLKKGASASYSFYDPGTWGATQRRSPLHVALLGKKGTNKKATIKLLLEAGADVNASNYCFYTTKRK